MTVLFSVVPAAAPGKDQPPQDLYLLWPGAVDGETVEGAPGPELRRTAEARGFQVAREGRLLPDCGWSHYTLFDVTYEPDAMSAAELEAGFREAVSAVFSREATERRSTIRRRILSHRKEPRL